MSLYVLDTDHLTLLRKGHAEVVARVAATPATDLAITILSIEEQFRGWFTQVRRARNPERLARAYQGLFDVIAMAASLRVLPFSRAAVDRYVGLRKTLRRVGKQDLAIAAVALEYDATVVTRNRQDFEQVPSLPVEDWSVPRESPRSPRTDGQTPSR
jgi:tRNA(fMet)-specific endonuclease VapC